MNHKTAQKTHKNIFMQLQIPEKRRRKDICGKVILTPVQSYLKAQMNYSDSILPSWKGIHLAPLKENPLLQGGKKGRAAALPHEMPASPNTQITPTHSYKGHQFVITNSRACPRNQKGTAPYHPLVVFRCLLPLLHQSDEERYHGHLCIEKIIGFGKWIDRSVCQLSFGSRVYTLIVLHSCTLHAFFVLRRFAKKSLDC